MEKRDTALREALASNEQETERWEQYIKENETAIESLHKFAQHLTVDVMVPVGKKMLMPGMLMHTNEILVGHFQGYFSKCSASKAKEICNFRIKSARQHLEKLQAEEKLLLNNLETPYMEGIIPTGEEQEIIEEFDEEREEQWRQTHKINLREHKLREKHERQMLENLELKSPSEESDKDVLKMLEERELMEELEKELEDLKIDNLSDETLKRLMSGEMQIPQDKKRIAHCSDESKSQALVDNKKYEEAVVSDDDEELVNIKEHMKYLTAQDQQTYLECNIKIVKEKLKALKLQNIEDLVEKSSLYGLLDELQSLLGCIDDEESEPEVEAKEVSEPDKKQKRRISFALSDESLEFNRHETVAQLLPPKPRDKITLETTNTPTPAPPTLPVVNKKELINKRVEDNLKYMHENQSAKDLDIIDNILVESTNSLYPMRIHFQHTGTAQSHAETAGDVPGKPSDFYAQYVSTKDQQSKTGASSNQILYVDGYKGEEEVHVPVLREAEIHKAYKKPLQEFSKSKANIKANVPNSEKSPQPNIKATKKTTEREELGNISAFARTVGDVIDKSMDVRGTPDPLPEGNFIDAHAPKKRISRFRQMRAKT